MGNDLSIWTLALDASPIVQAVMALLLAASVTSWAVIFKKGRVISYSIRQADQFETAFWSAAICRRCTEVSKQGTGGDRRAEHLRVGLRRIQPVAPTGVAHRSAARGARRAMRVAQMREQDRLERNLAMLATVGSTSPYVGLFGTVWGS